MSVRYYFWADNALLRVSSKLHFDLIDRKTAIQRFAGTDQKVIEVILRKLSERVRAITVQGSVYTFDEIGFLDLRPGREAALEGYGEPSRSPPGVIDFQPLLRKRRYESRYKWIVPKDVIGRVKLDMRRGNNAARPKISWLKP